jgi:hypothetical protein
MATHSCCFLAIGSQRLFAEAGAVGTASDIETCGALVPGEAGNCSQGRGAF